MDDDSVDTNMTDGQPDSSADPTVGQRAAEAVKGLREAAQNAKDTLGSGDDKSSGPTSGSGGAPAGDSKHGSEAPEAKGSKGAEGVKAAESGSKPNTPNNTSSETDSANPSAANFAQIAGAHAANHVPGGQAAGTAANAAHEMKENVQDAEAVAEIAGGNLAKIGSVLRRWAKDPKGTAKRLGHVVLAVGGLIFLQFAIVAIIFAVFVFSVYKVYLAGKSAWERPWDIANTLKVSRDMGQYLATTAGQLAYERQVEEARKSGVVLAEDTNRKNYDLSGVQLNPDTQKTFEAWDNGELAEKFLDDYHAEIKPRGSTRQVDNYDPSAWDLYVSGKKIGPVDGTKAKAFLSVFAEDTTHWKDIYTRKALQDVAQTDFNNTSFKLDLPSSKGSIKESRKNVTEKLVGDTLKPISENAGNYYDCLIDGSDSCDNLGLGSQNAPSNNPREKSGGVAGGIFNFLGGLFDKLKADNRPELAREQLVSFANNKATEVSAEASSYERKDELAANISTAASDAVLSSVDKSKDTGAPDSEVLLQMYDQFKEATDNMNFSRVNYDRSSRQSVGQGMNYFIAGGQLLNRDIGVLDSWALTENLGKIEQSQSLRQAVFGNPIGAYAQSQNGQGSKVCQNVYDDGDPVGSISDGNLTRGVKKSSCFTPMLLPNIEEFKSEKSLNTIYKKLDSKTNTLKSDSRPSDAWGWASGLFQGNLDKLRKNKLRTSPVSASSVDISNNLAPDLDAYTNQVYGISKTGAEIDGQAYDTLKMAAESLWSAGEATGTYSTGGSYQSDAAVAANLRYALKFKQAQYAFKPVGERFLSLKTPDSLAGKLALLTPSNPRDMAQKTLALFKPSNLTSAVATRFSPTSFAQSVTEAQVNPVGGVRLGYSASDPNLKKSSMSFWNDNNCGAGGAQQDVAQPQSIPFTLPTSSNPCKMSRVLSVATSCWFDSDDSCTLDSTALQSTNTTNSGIEGDIGLSSGGPKGVACAEGSNDIGDVVSKYRGSQAKDNPLVIKLCQVPGVGGRGNDTNGNNIEGGIVVNSRVSGAWVALGRAAKADGIQLSGSSFRLNDSCGGTGTGSACAKPGTSMHQLGIAVDFSSMGTKAGSTSSCSQRAGAVNDPRWLWLFTNAQRFGIKQYSYEPWHWDLAPLGNRCDSSSPAIGQTVTGGATDVRL